MKVSRATGVTALIAHGYGASLSAIERDDSGTPVRQILIELGPADRQMLQAALEELDRGHLVCH